MKTRPVFPLLTSSLLLLSGGCGFFPFPGGNDTAQSPEPPTPQQAPDAPPPVPAPESTALPDVDMAALGLIPPVTPAQRRSEIAVGRTNPFALIPVQATLRQSVCQIEPMSEEEAGKGNTPSEAVVTKAAKPTTPASQSEAKTNGATLTSGTTTMAPPALNIKPLYPNDARAVVVSGIVQIEQKDFAIIKAPGEAVARHVTVGDRLAGGKVRVTAINASQREPGVVLEQFDQAVIRTVGEPALPPLTSPPPGKDGTITITNPDGTTVQIPAAMAQQQLSGTGTQTAKRPVQLPLERVALRGSDAEDGGYGEIRNLAVLKLGVNRRGSNLVNSTGILCNAGDEALKVRRLTFQVEDPEDNTILDSIQVLLGRTYSIQTGQKLEFDGAAPVFRGRSPEDVVVKLIDWSSDEK